MKIEEKISLTCGRDGGLQNMELHGMIMLRILEEKFARIRLHVENEDKRGVQLQVRLTGADVCMCFVPLASEYSWQLWKHGVLCSVLCIFVDVFSADALKMARVTANVIAAQVMGQITCMETEVHLEIQFLALIFSFHSLIYSGMHIGLSFISLGLCSNHSSLLDISCCMSLFCMLCVCIELPAASVE